MCGTAPQIRWRWPGDWTHDAPLDLPALRERLKERFCAVDFDQAKAKADILPFLKDPRELDIWSQASQAFFMGLIPMIQKFKQR